MPLNTSNIPNSVKQVLTLFGGAIAIIYSIGYVVVTTYMLNFGVTDISLARVHYVSVGVFFILFSALTIIPTAWFVYILYQAVFKRIESRKRMPLLGLKFNVINFQLGFYSFLAFLMFTIFIPYTLFLFASETGTGAEVVNYSQNLKGNFYIRLWEIIPDWFGPMFGIGAFIGFFLTLRILNEKINSKLNLKTNLVTSRGKEIKPKVKILMIKSAKMALIMVIVCMIPYLSLIAVHTYAVEIYPDIKPGFGGGNLGTIQIVTDSAGASVLCNLITMEDSRKTVPVRLLGEGGKFYSVLPDTSSKKAVMIEKSFVKGIISSEIPQPVKQTIQPKKKGKRKKSSD